MSLSAGEIARYKRHLLLREVGGQGQQKLKEANVLVIGAGGLGCPILSYLAAAGVGHLTILDGDHVELSNLQRQPLYTSADIGHPKAVKAAEALEKLNPEGQYTALEAYFDSENAQDITEGYDLVIEGIDRFAPRYLVNRACHDQQLPLLSAAIGRFDGQIALFPMTPHSACYQCFVPEAPADAVDCETEGVLGAVPGVVGSLAALEALKFLIGMNGALDSELLIYQGLSSQLRRITLPKDPACPTCGEGIASWQEIPDS